METSAAIRSRSYSKLKMFTSGGRYSGLWSGKEFAGNEIEIKYLYEANDQIANVLVVGGETCYICGLLYCLLLKSCPPVIVYI